MKLLDPIVQAAVDAQTRVTPYRDLIEVVVGATTYRWATATVDFDPGTGLQNYEGRVVEIGHVHGLIVDGLRNSASKRTFDFAIADPDNTFASKQVGYFAGAKVIVREVFDGIAAEGRSHSFVVDRVGTTTRNKLSFECSARSPMTSSAKVGRTVKSGDFTTMEKGVIGTSIPMIFGSKNLRLPLISSEEGIFLVGYGDVQVDHLYQNAYSIDDVFHEGTELLPGGGPNGFAGFSIIKDSTNTYTAIQFVNPSNARNIAISGAPILPLTAAVTRTGTWQGSSSGEIGYGLNTNNPVNVFAELWRLGDGDIWQDLDATTFNAAGYNLAVDGISFNCRIDGERIISKLLNDLLLSCACRVVVTDKVYFYRASSPPSNPLVFTPTNILRSKDGIGTTFSQLDVDVESIHNKGSITFQKYDKYSDDQNAENWKAEYTDAASVSEIGTQERAETSLFIGDFATADRAVQAMIRQEVAGLREYTFETTLQAMALDEGDRTDITFPDRGLSAKAVLVTRVVRISSRRVQVTVRELASTYWVDPGAVPAQGDSVDPALATPAKPVWPVGNITKTTRVEADGTVLQDLFIDWEDVVHPLLTGYDVWEGINTPVTVDANGDAQSSQHYGFVNRSYISIIGAEVGSSYFFRVRAKTANGLVSPISDEVAIAVTAKSSAPSNVSGLTAEREIAGIRLSWNPVLDSDLAYYEVREGSTWATGTVLDNPKTTSFLWKVVVTGSYMFWVSTVDTSGNYSLVPSGVAFVASAPSTPITNPVVYGQSKVTLSWSEVTSIFPLDSYTIYEGATWPATQIAVLKSLTIDIDVTWNGTKTFWVTAMDVAGNVSSPGNFSAAVVPPSVSGVTSKIIDNNALFTWTVTPGSLAVGHTVIRQGAVFSSSTVVYESSGTFASLFEQSGGDYTFWFVPVDVAGNVGTEVSITVKIDQPPDYVLNTEWVSSLGGTVVNMITDANGFLLFPVNATESFDNHFTSHAFLSPQDQIDAGYPYFTEPSPLPASYDEEFDYGALLSSSMISVSKTENFISGSATSVITLSVRDDPVNPWINYVGLNQILATNFRYVKVHIDYTSAGGDDVIELSSIIVRLDAKLRSDAGKGTAVSSDPSGTTVNFTYAFVDVASISVTPKGTTPVTAIYDFVDIPNPTSFSVYLFDATGARLSGDFSWSARGY